MNFSRYIYDTNANIRLERQGEHTVSYAYEHNGLKRFIGHEGMHFSLIRDCSGNINRIVQGGLNTTMEFDVRGTLTSLTKLKCCLKLKNQDAITLLPTHLVNGYSNTTL